MSKHKKNIIETWDDDEIDWLAASFSTAYNNYEDEFGDIFSPDEDEDETVEELDADDYLLMYDDDEDDEDY